MTETLSAADFGVLSRMLAAIENGDKDELRSCFAPDALAWHNDNCVDQDVNAMIAVLDNLCALSTSRSYENRSITTTGSQAFLQHTLTATLRSGRQFRLPAMMRVQVDSDGLVTRLEEYYDSRATDCLAEEAS